ncbi:hypothetical protein JCM19297_711 [Nonlabens ulvanivorans]|nr:hypothetical protein JCM19297_711 [Nonlabens ulvanivorans]
MERDNKKAENNPLPFLSLKFAPQSEEIKKIIFFQFDG